MTDCGFCVVAAETRIPLRVLEVGASAGLNLRFDRYAYSSGALRWGDDRSAVRFEDLYLDGRTPPHPIALDVIEHIDDDRAALASIAARLKPGGKLLMTVPAHQWMWSAHDVANHHQRRYSKRGLRQLIEQSPLRLDRLERR